MTCKVFGGTLSLTLIDHCLALLWFFSWFWHRIQNCRRTYLESTVSYTKNLQVCRVYRTVGLPNKPKWAGWPQPTTWLAVVCLHHPLSVRC